MIFTIDWNNYNFNDYLDINKNKIDILPQGLGISTMCSSCKLNTKLNISNIEKYLQLNENDILSIEKDCIKSLISKINYKRKKNKKESVKKTTYFYNQITIDIRITHGDTKNLDKEPRINIKLFKNGTIQMSGCKNINDINIILNKLIFRLKEIKAIFENGKIVEKLFIEDYDSITIKDFNIYMINTNYRTNLLIDRPKLYNLLLKKKIKTIYEPCNRACVIIKYTPPDNNLEEKEVSIFIFQEGNVIITGARSTSHILSAYNYTNDILLTHKDDIIKKEEKQESNLIFELYDEIINDVNMGLIKLT